MRWHLLRTFDKIYIIDLHGNSKKKEISPDGTKDANVFNVQQGVSIIIGIRNSGQKKNNESLGECYHAELYGSRLGKFQKLNDDNLEFQKVELDEKMFYFKPMNTKGQATYEKGILITELMPKNVTGVVSGNDNLTMLNSLRKITELTNNIKTATDEDILKIWKKFGRGQTAQKIKQDVNSGGKITQIDYRPFDKRWTYYSGISYGFLFRPRDSRVMINYFNENVGLAICRQQKIFGFNHVFVHKNIMESSFVSNRTSEITYTLPLYIYPNENALLSDEKQVNFDEIKLKELTNKLTKKPSEIEIFDYIYGILSSLKYRKKYNVFLKLDFPRIPIPKDNVEFKQYSKMGKKLRELHLKEPTLMAGNSIEFKGDGDFVVNSRKVKFQNGKVFINETQYFKGITEEQFNFFIGGYQPLQKWLKDRNEKVLSNTDIDHYSGIVNILAQTIEIMSKNNEQ
jgi:predicted helicase